MCPAASENTNPVSNVLLTVAALVFLATAATGVHYRTNHPVLVYETENAVRVEPAFEILALQDTSGNRVLSIAQHKGRGWNHEAGGLAEYNIHIRHAGEYWLWLRTYWRGGCENAVYVKANGDREILAGNDAVFDQWHWVKSGPVTFHQGNNKLFLTNHSDGIMIDKFELVQSVDYKPEGFGSEVKHFFDGFGGCDGNNAGSWTALSGDWKVTGDAAGNQDGRGAVLMQLSDNESITLAEQIQLKKFHAQFVLQSGENGEIGVVLKNSDSSQYNKLLWHKDGRLTLSLADRNEPIEIGSLPRLANIWSYWDLFYKDGKLTVTINDDPIGKPVVVNLESVCLGLYTNNCPYSSFDNIRIDCIDE